MLPEIITAELAFKNLRALTLTLYRERHGEDGDFGLLRELMNRSAKAEQKRNQITHSVWAAGETPDTITRVKATAKEKRGIHFDFEKVGEAELEGVATELKTLAGDLQALHLQLIQRNKAINNPSAKLW